MSFYSRISTLSLLATLTAVGLITTGCDVADDEPKDELIDAVERQESAVSVSDAEAAEAAEAAEVAEAVAAGKSAAQQYIAFTKAVTDHDDEINACYKLGLAEDPELSGQVVLAFTAADDGTVTKVRSAEDTMGAGVSECLRDAALSWRLPPAMGSDELRYPFDFPSSESPEQVEPAKASVEGGLDHGLIRRIVNAHVNEIRHCYKEGLSRDPELSGRVLAEFTISGQGTVAELPRITGSIGDAEVDSCVASAIQRWRFPKTEGGEKVLVTYPFVFTPG